MTLCELQASFAAEVLLKDAEPDKFSSRTERETASTLRPYYEYFGMTPASRARIQVPKAKVEEPKSKWNGILK